MRRYGAKGTVGTPEDPSRCVVQVYTKKDGVHQCPFKRQKNNGARELAGLLCGVHDAMVYRGGKLIIPKG